MDTSKSELSLSKEEIENIQDASLGQLIASSNKTVENLEKQLNRNSANFKKEKSRLLDEIEKREQIYSHKLDVRDREVDMLKQNFDKARRIEETKNTTLFKQNKILEKALKGNQYLTPYMLLF